MRIISIIFSVFYLSQAFANTKVAQVLMMKGQVRSKDLSGELKDLKKKDWVLEGSLLQTAAKSFVRMRFVDGSTTNLGPNSKMVINKYKKGETGLISLVRGQLRSKVTKDPLRKDKSKLHIKTQTAAMGVRGTELQVIFNEENQRTSLVTFTGEVAMAQMVAGENIPSSAELEKIVNSDRAVICKDGQYSGTSQSGRTNVPVKISPVQVAAMQKNNTFGVVPSAQTAGLGKTGQAPKKYNNIVPPGVNTKLFVNENSALVESVASVAGSENVETAVQEVDAQKADAPPPEGFVDSASGAFAPPAGGMIDPNTGIYIAPPPGSTYDANAGVYIPPPTLGGVDPDTGNYVPPAGFELSPQGTFEKAPETNQTPESTTAVTGSNEPPPPGNEPPPPGSEPPPPGSEPPPADAPKLFIVDPAESNYDPNQFETAQSFEDSSGTTTKTEEASGSDDGTNTNDGTNTAAGDEYDQTEIDNAEQDAEESYDSNETETPPTTNATVNIRVIGI